ncbi:MAG: AbrB/MazE/SpoVT family DNA-binding domain-containing protein [Phycisphaerales bacterium]|nr:AbrB/MazE/SpoVT family DNA-binding domain-containing protein [Phycisphaerales bacterium]
MQTAKVFRHGGSQAVRLPAEYRFDHSEVFIWRDEATGYLVLSAQPATWEHFLSLRNQCRAEHPDEITSFSLAPPQEAPCDRDPFVGWTE